MNEAAKDANEYVWRKETLDTLRAIERSLAAITVTLERLAFPEVWVTSGTNGLATST